MIISVDAEETNKTQIPFMKKKLLSNLGIKETPLNRIKAI